MTTTSYRGSPLFPASASIIDSSSRAILDEALAVLQTTKDVWPTLGIPERVALLDEVLCDMAPLGEAWVGASIAAKGLPPGSLGEGEEWFMFGGLLRNIQQYRRSLRAILHQGRPHIPGGLTRRADGRVMARVFPTSRYDALLFPGVTADVWMRPGVPVDEVQPTRARIYQEDAPHGGIGLVLGAGNASFLPPADIMARLFTANQVVILKMNPVNAYLGPLLERGFRALIARGFLRIVYGGAQEGWASPTFMDT